MAAFKDEFSPRLVAALGHELLLAWPEFPVLRWRAEATRGLEDLELLQRVDHLAARLVECLPGDFARSAAILLRLLDRPQFDGWMMLPCGYFVATAGIDAPHVALPVLAALTPRFSSEGPIRPFIEHHPAVTFRYLHEWTSHPDAHVRRLVFEGTRPRLPWAPQLKQLRADPTQALGLLDKLFDDESEYVRRSVANHLNDISKDHPDIALDRAARWQRLSTHGDYVIRHGLRTLIKKGDRRALAMLGFDRDSLIELLGFECRPTFIEIGDEVTWQATLTAATETKAMIDYVVHYQGVSGLKDGKVFKLTTRTIDPGHPMQIERRHRFAHVSVRRIHAGPHRIEIQVNGRILGGATIEVTEAAAPG